MNPVVGTVLNALEIAADCSGLPYANLVTSLLQGIHESCEKVGSHKREAKRLANKASKLYDVLGQHEGDLQHSELRDRANDVLHTLRKVHTRTREISQYNRFSAFLNDNKISEGIKTCDSDLDVALESFNVTANVIVARTQYELRTLIQSHHEELRGVLFNVLRNPANVTQIVELERSGTHVAQRIMDAGQKQLSLVAQELAAEADTLRPSPDAPAPEIPYPEVYSETQRGLLQLHNLTGILPTVKVLNGMVTKEGQIPVAGGIYSDVYLGYWLGDKVALKAMRGIRTRKHNTNLEKAIKTEKRFESQVNIWSDLSHPNILKFLGILTDRHYVHLVLPWQENGNLLTYVKNHPSADRLHLIVGAAKGLAYLHSRKVLHGNLKCTNILVTSEGEACISDFGMAKVIEDVTEQSASTVLTSNGSARWLAPELIITENAVFTLACDVYSFAMTMLECFTLEFPFATLKRDAQVIQRLMTTNSYPDRPRTEAAQQWISDDIWNMMLGCWNMEPAQRPQMEQVAEQLLTLEQATHTEDDAYDFMDVEAHDAPIV